MLDGKIILVDDNEAVLKTLKMILAREFKTVVGVSVPTLLPALLREGDVDIVLLDMNFVTGRQDGSEGLFWLDRIVGRPDPPQVVLITAFGDIELAVSALKRGAADFVVKPWDNEKLVAILQGAFRRRRKVRTEADIGRGGEWAGCFPFGRGSVKEIRTGVWKTIAGCHFRRIG